MTTLRVTETGSLPLAQLISRLEHAQKQLIPDARKSIADEALRQIDHGFAASRDPYGVPWAPLKGGGAPLRGLRGTFGVRTANLTIYGATPKLKPFVFAFLNYGTRNVTGANKGKSRKHGPFQIAIVNGKKRRVYDAKKRTMHVPTRLMIPRSKLGLPGSWERAFDPRVQRLFDEQLAKGG